MERAKSPPLLPADTTQVTPAATELQIALCQASRLELPQLPSSAPLPAMLMLATRMPRLAAFEVTQSIAQRICDSVPVPVRPRAFTAYSGVPGATPTNP